MDSQSTEPQKLTLTDHLRARTKVIIDPVVNVLARLNVSPDALTVFGMLLHFLYAWLIASGNIRLAGVAIALGVPLDALDGALARKIGSANVWMVAVAYIALTGSLMVSYTRSRAEALGLSCKVGILTRVERYVVIILSLILNLPEVGIVILAVGTYITVAQRIWHVRQQARNVKS
jgi:CDP-diacylglycerol--glycerol-3-phosphate 3-phosphatidyltransferase